MGLFGPDVKKIDAMRQEFIDRCISYDKERLETEVFPDGVTVLSDIVYDPETGENGLLDIYFPGEEKGSFDEAFFLIHGGAFVYGNKGLDKNYGMHLALKAGLPVINVNYTLMPGKDLAGEAEELCRALAFAGERYGLTKIHTTGDSAGGYLALLTAFLCNDSKIREDLKIKTEPEVRCLSANLICGGFRFLRNTFPSYYMAKEPDAPGYIFDMGKAVTESFARAGKIPLSVITGDKDTMLRDCRYLKKVCDREGIPCSFYNAESAGERMMYHVYPVAHPQWPESQKVIGMFVANAKG